MTYCPFNGLIDGASESPSSSLLSAACTIRRKHQEEENNQGVTMAHGFVHRKMRTISKEHQHHSDDDCTMETSSSSSCSSSSSSSSSLPPLSQGTEELHKSSTANYCPLLQRTKIPSPVQKIGWMAFYQFTSLVEVSFGSNNNNNRCCSKLREISSCAFMDCRSLQVVSLPDSLEKISYGAFGSCVNLTTVAMPVGKSIRIKAFAFRKCESLSNIVVSPNSVIDQRSFEGCTRLQECLGSLKGRFDGYPIHQLCYYHQTSTTSVEELRKALNTVSIGGDDKEKEEESNMVDMFGMTPFHVLFSSAEPRQDLFQLLLQKYPPRVLGLKDANGKRAMDYLATNFTPETAILLKMALQVWMFGPLDRWGATGWSKHMKDQVNTLLANDHDLEKRTDLLQNACSKMEEYERNEAMTILELGVWKKELLLQDKKTKMMMNYEQQQQHQTSHRRRSTALNLCGSCCVLSNVAPFLGIASAFDAPAPRDDELVDD